MLPGCTVLYETFGGESSTDYSIAKTYFELINVVNNHASKDMEILCKKIED